MKKEKISNEELANKIKIDIFILFDKYGIKNKGFFVEYDKEEKIFRLIYDGHVFAGIINGDFGVINERSAIGAKAIDTRAKLNDFIEKFDKILTKYGFYQEQESYCTGVLCKR